MGDWSDCGSDWSIATGVQLWSESAACQEEAIACLGKAEDIKQCLQHLRSAQPPVASAEASTAAALSGAKLPGCAEIEDCARAYAASAANVPKQVLLLI